MPSLKSFGISLVSVAVALSSPALAQTRPARPPLPDDVQKRSVTIWSDGTRMAGDLYLPKEIKAGEKLPAVVFCSGVGGVKSGSPVRMAPIFVQHGYAFLAFDYRGWGESDCKLMLIDRMPKPDDKNRIEAPVKAIRWQLDAIDQCADIRCAIDFMSGEPVVDSTRIGLIGTSYGGGLVTWVTEHDSRVRCAAVQVPGMNGGRTEAAVKYARDLAIKQARGETEPVPQETGKLGGKLSNYPQMRANPAKGIDFNPVEDAGLINVPMLLIDAEKEELMDPKQNGGKAYETIKARGNVPVEHHILPGISHYGVYAEAFAEATRLELDWFDRYLKTANGK